MVRTWALRACAGAISTLMLTGNAVAGSRQLQAFERDEAEDCDALVGEPIPEAYAGPLETAPLLDLRVYVVLDGISLARGQKIMARVAEAYDTIGIDLQATYQEVSIEPDAIDDDVGGTGQPAHGDGLLPSIKAAVGGARPWGTDVVYAMTSDNIAKAAGYAECIGGVRFAGHPFAVGEAAIEPSEDTGVGNNNRSAKIAAHEIGHLLGAHHHYANCAEQPKDLGGLFLAEYCTVMINDVGLMSLGWSMLESSVIRGHVAEFAIGATMGSEPVHKRSLRFKITKRGVGKGTLASQTSRCVSTSVVTLERKKRKRWIEVSQEESFSTGGYTFPGPLESGVYRTSIPGSYFEGHTHRESCPPATSPQVTLSP